MWLDSDLTWSAHVNKLSVKIKRNIHLLQNHRNVLDSYTLRLIYLAQIQSHINYGLVVWGGMASAEQLNKKKNTQLKCLKIIKPNMSPIKISKELRILSLDQLIDLEYKKL